LVALTHVYQLINQFCNFHLNKNSWKFIFSFTYFCYLSKKFRNCQFFDNNIISVKAAKVIWYITTKLQKVQWKLQHTSMELIRQNTWIRLFKSLQIRYMHDSPRGPRLGGFKVARYPWQKLLQQPDPSHFGTT